MNKDKNQLVRINMYNKSFSWVDRYLLFSFFLFTISSWIYEWYIIFEVDFNKYEDGKSWDIFGRSWRWYAVTIDPIFLHTPPWLRIMCALDCYLFGSFYLLLIYAFLKRKEWIRLPAIIFASMLLYSTIVYFWYEFTEEGYRADLLWVVIINIPYSIMPIILIIRMKDLSKKVWENGDTNKPGLDINKKET